MASVKPTAARAEHQGRLPKLNRQLAVSSERTNIIAKGTEVRRIRNEFNLKCAVEHVVPFASRQARSHGIGSTQIITSRDKTAKGCKRDHPVTPFTRQELLENPGLVHYLKILQRKNLPTFTSNNDGSYSRTALPGIPGHAWRTPIRVGIGH